MQPYKREFIDFMVRSGVLLFGDFVTKSGRRTPYFVNTGKYRTGEQLRALGGYYAEAAIEVWGDGFDVLFGPAYKGIPLVCAASLALADRGREVAYAFDRKERKDHGEGGVIVGHQPADGDRVLILEDVTTAGTSIRETVPKVRAAADIDLVGLLISVDRREKGPNGRGALDQLADEFSMRTHAIVTIHEVVEHLHRHEVDGKVHIDDEARERIAGYLSEYGID